MKDCSKPYYQSGISNPTLGRDGDGEHRGTLRRGKYGHVQHICCLFEYEVAGSVSERLF